MMLFSKPGGCLTVLLLVTLVVIVQQAIALEVGPQGLPSYFGGRRCRWPLKGRLMFDPKTRTILGCDGMKWDYIANRISGNTKFATCDEIQKKGGSVGDGYYFLTHGGKTYRAFCDMTTEGGGWTLFSTKSYCTFAKLFTYEFNTKSASAVSQDSGGCIPASVPWREVLFRFKGDGGASYVVFNRHDGSTSSGKDTFVKFLTCGNYKELAWKDYGSVSGFYRHTPYNNDGQRTPPINFGTISELCLGSNKGVSENHVGSDKWLDLWDGRDATNSYYKVSSSVTQGRKCVAGVCRQNDPVWIMYR